jgi:hypothetical protein
MGEAFNEAEILSKIKGTGVSTHDAPVIADCIVTRKSCSWVNTDPVNHDIVRKLLTVIKENNYRIDLSIKAVSSRDKFIWEIKALP